ncbi:MAG: acyl transferase [Sphingobacteriales bacterium]|nr:MAG: acyl transferase [Sphingobacteriales bacterium]
MALQLFRYQYGANTLYRSYTDALGVKPEGVQELSGIPFLPISFFKSHEVKSTDRPFEEAALVFESSGTTGSINSRHALYRPDVYKVSLLEGFRAFYGDPASYAILALLPSYLERKNASLVYMAQNLMDEGNHPDSGFFLNDWNELARRLKKMEQAGQKTLLLGVTFALLDAADAIPMKLKHTLVMETGGMKGRREEWTRLQVHEFLKARWSLKHVHSEYGMTELLSQAYAPSDGLFRCASTMKVLIRDINDPLDVRASGQGCINVIDLANIDSCSFIGTEDIGRLREDGSFEVLGRIDHAALRGCSLMAV